ncbi:MAG: hypothetical protein RLZZ396_804 [Planctomycetota bacterium]|jgi:hypothetical protein
MQFEHRFDHKMDRTWLFVAWQHGADPSHHVCAAFPPSAKTIFIPKYWQFRINCSAFVLRNTTSFLSSRIRVTVTEHNSLQRGCGDIKEEQAAFDALDFDAGALAAKAIDRADASSKSHLVRPVHTAHRRVIDGVLLR